MCGRGGGLVRPPVAGMTADPGAGWDLIAAAQAGDRDAFGQLYARYAGGVSRFVGTRLRDRGAVEDLTSETFTRALRRIDSVTDQGRDVGAWFTTIARNLVLDHVKSSRHRLETATADPPDPSPSTDNRGPEQAVIENDTAAELHRHIARLPAAQQECIRGRFMQELSVAETAAAMGRGEGAVKALQHRAIIGLRAAMTGDNSAGVAPASEPADKELPAQRRGFAEKRPPADPLERARQAVGEVRQHREAADRHAVEEQGRAQQVAGWHADGHANELQHRELDRGAVAQTEGVA
jgi:RNA polymerase sigma-70 factor (ECF subfamily)